MKIFPLISPQGTFKENLLKKLHGQGKLSHKVVKWHSMSKTPVNK